MKPLTMKLFAGALLGFWIAGCAQDSQDAQTTEETHMAVAQAAEHFEVVKSEAEWKRILPPQSFEIMRHHDTEPPFTGKYDKNKADGIYYCRACGQKLFDSRHKFDSGTGWPSFYQPISKGMIGTREDRTFGVRTEVHCSRCGGHLGHVFDDGPQPTGLRYCMNSASLDFKGRKEAPPKLLK